MRKFFLLYFAKNVMMALGDIPEKNVNLFFDIYTIGFVKAFEKISK